MATGDATRFIQRLIDEQQYRGRTTQAALEEAFDAPARGVLLVDQALLKRIVKKHRALPELIYHVPRAESYTLPKAALLDALASLDPGLQQSWRERIGVDDVTLLALPDAESLDFYAIEHFGLKFWARLAHESVHLHCSRQEGVRSDQGFLRRAVATIGLVEFEEVREVLAAEHLIFDASDDAEVLVEFIATWVELSWFSPELIPQFFPSLISLTTEIDALLAALDVDAKALIKACRPLHTPSLPGLETRRESRRRSAGESLEIHQVQFHLDKLMNSLEHQLGGEASGAAADDSALLKRLEPLVNQLIGLFIKKERIVRGVSFDDLRKRFLVEDHRSARALLLLDTVLRKELGRLYRPARKAERHLLEREGDAFLERVRANPALREATDEAIASMDKRWQRYLQGYRVSLLRRALLALPHLLAFVLYRWWSDVLVRRLLFQSAFALKIYHRRCLRQMRDALAEAGRRQAQGNRVLKALALRRALALIAGVGSRYPTEAFFDLDRRMREALAQQLGQMADWFADGHRVEDSLTREAIHDLVEYLIDRAESAPRGRELRMLFDMQASVQKSERQYSKLDISGWTYGFFRGPLVRDLPHQAEMMAVKYLRAAREKLGDLKVKRSDIKRFGAALDGALDRHAVALRREIDQRVGSSLAQVGLLPATPREVDGERKLRGDLTDLALKRAQISFPELRDAISRNDLKLPELHGRQILRDSLLQLDKTFRQTLFGVYAPAPIYLRLLQRLNAPVFGTAIGRFLTLYLLMPVLCAIVLIEGGHHTIGVLVEKTITHRHVDWLTPESLALTSLALMCVINFSWGWAIVRACGLFIGRLMGHIFRAIYQLLLSRGLMLFAQLVLLPLILAGLVAGAGFLIEAEVYSGAAVQKAIVAGAKKVTQPDITHMFEDGRVVRRLGLYYIGGYLLFAILLNTVYGRRFRDWLNHIVSDTAHRLKKTLWTGLFLGVMVAFARAMAWIEHLRYTVENSLRHTKRDGRLTFLGKSLVGVIWFWISYVFVLYITLLVEPQINPIKHFPVVTVSHKFMIPILPTLTRGMVALTPPFVPQWIAYPVIGLTVFLIPGLCGFLVWELKENWKLYRATRSKVVQPVLVGSHGETLPRLLRKGFHSGTVPKTLAKMRRAGRVAHASGDWTTVNRLRHELHHIEEDLQRFAGRSLVEPLCHDVQLRGINARIGHVRLTTNKITLPLVLSRGEGEALEISLHFEDVFSWIIGSCSHDEAGYAAFLSEAERAQVDVHLAVFFKQAGVELVREQLEQALLARLQRWSDLVGNPTEPVLSYEIQDDRVYLDVFDAHGLELAGRFGFNLLEQTSPAWFERAGEVVEAELDQVPREELVFAAREVAWAAIDQALTPRDEPSTEVSGGGADSFMPISRAAQIQFRGIR